MIINCQVKNNRQFTFQSELKIFRKFSSENKTFKRRDVKLKSYNSYCLAVIKAIIQNSHF